MKQNTELNKANAHPGCSFIDSLASRSRPSGKVDESSIKSHKMTQEAFLIFYDFLSRQWGPL